MGEDGDEGEEGETDEKDGKDAIRLRSSRARSEAMFTSEPHSLRRTLSSKQRNSIP